MNRHKRPIEAVLPTATRPQLVHIGRRRRIEHLSKNARVNEGTKPCGLPNEVRQGNLTQGPGSSSKGLAYRNSVFQALLNTPMFVNFVRMHATRWYPSNLCPVHPSCLTCTMAHLAARYWQQQHTSEAARMESVELGCKVLWTLCQKTFWPRSTPLGRIGPSNLEDEFYADTFLLSFLKEMRSQLEQSPSEYQTFEKMFSVHTVCRWRCSSKSCRWISPPYKWESSLHLNLAVQRPHPKSRQTPVLIGIERALRAKMRLTGRRTSTPHQEKCDKCQKPIESFSDIVSLPEVLIVVRDIEELLPGDEPDIPFRQELNMSGLSSGSDDNLDPKGYELVAGIAENRYSPLVSRDCVFVRAAKDPGDKWFCIMDETIQETEFSVLDKLQRSVTDGGLADCVKVCPICPEVFIYRLKDYDTRSELIDNFGPITPLNDNTMVRDAISRTISDIFTQKIGKGLLKFKVKISPVDPGPQDNNTIEVDLKLSYEIDGKHYGVVNNKENFLAFQLKPLQQADRDSIDAIWTPYEGRATDRAVRTWMGVYPQSKEEAMQQTSAFAGQMNLPDPSVPTTQTGCRGSQLGQNPFAQAAGEEMDVDPTLVPFGQFPDAERVKDAIQRIKDRGKRIKKGAKQGKSGHKSGNGNKNGNNDGASKLSHNYNDVNKQGAKWQNNRGGHGGGNRGRGGRHFN